MNTELLKQQFDSVLHGSYPGYSLFIERVLRPIFGEVLEFEYGGEDMLTAHDYSPAITASILKANKVAQINSIDSNTIEVYDVTIKDSVNITRARVGIRELIKRLEFPYSHAFILFHYEQPEGHSWRFSYFYKEGTNASTTSGKRYTYVFGPQYTARTARDRFVELSQTEIKNDEALLKAFSVEALSKEFFDEYRNLYADFIQYITGKRYVKTGANKWEEKNLSEPNETIYASFDHNDKDIRDYIKKMMGRLVFLCFLQRKGWLGNNKQYLQDLFTNSAYQDNFLEAVLEPLFFGLLNTKPEERPALFASKDWDISLIPNADTIPYLNGGLFEQDTNDDRIVIFPKEMFQRLFDFFASYNFTIDENDPNDAEIGVDPEMLGKIFENLLEDNKDKGAFYTPKEIVQYMCRESLIAYLTTKSIESNNGKFPREEVENKVRELLTNPNEIVPHMKPEHFAKFDKAIREVKICDPAVGSGAFPMGLLNELVRCRVSINAWAKDENGNLLVGDYAELKRDIIQNSIYGVDIEKGAIDIARLRFWLSIVVDEESPKALPNFDYKFMVGNSLISTFDGEYINLDTKTQKHGNVRKMEDLKRELLKLKRQYYDAFGEDKHLLSVKIKDTILQLIAHQLGYEFRSWAASHIEQGSLFPEPKQMTIQEIVTQLPPERQRIVDLGKKLRERLANENIPLSERARTDIQFFDWRMMFTEVFDKENGGFDIVIGNPPYIRRTSLPDCDKSIYESKFESANGQYDIYLLFIEFGASILCKKGHLCFINPIRFFNADYGIGCRSFIVKNETITSILDISQLSVFANAMTYPCILMLENRKADDNQIRYCKLNDLSLILNLDKSNYRYFSQDIFDKTSEYNFIIPQDNTTASIIAKIDNSLECIGLYYDNARGLANNKVDFLGQNYLALKSKSVKKYHILETVRIDTDYANRFEDEMIIMPRTVLRLQATIKPKDIVLLDRIYYLLPKEDRNLSFILGIINSKITNFWFEYYYSSAKVSGNYFDLNGNQIKSIPLPICNNEQPIISLVDKILAAKQSDPSADTSDLENQIDELVYDLYGLTEPEKEIIRKS